MILLMKQDLHHLMHDRLGNRDFLRAGHIDGNVSNAVCSHERPKVGGDLLVNQSPIPY